MASCLRVAALLVAFALLVIEASPADLSAAESSSSAAYTTMNNAAAPLSGRRRLLEDRGRRRGGTPLLSSSSPEVEEEDDDSLSRLLRDVEARIADSAAAAADNRGHGDSAHSFGAGRPGSFTLTGAAAPLALLEENAMYYRKAGSRLVEDRPASPPAAAHDRPASLVLGRRPAAEAASASRKKAGLFDGKFSERAELEALRSFSFKEGTMSRATLKRLAQLRRKAGVDAERQANGEHWGDIAKARFRRVSVGLAAATRMRLDPSDTNALQKTKKLPLCPVWPIAVQKDEGYRAKECNGHGECKEKLVPPPPEIMVPGELPAAGAAPDVFLDLGQKQGLRQGAGQGARQGLRQRQAQAAQGSPIITHECQCNEGWDGNACQDDLLNSQHACSPLDASCNKVVPAPMPPCVGRAEDFSLENPCADPRRVRIPYAPIDPPPIPGGAESLVPFMSGASDSEAIKAGAISSVPDAAGAETETPWQGSWAGIK